MTIPANTIVSVTPGVLAAGGTALNLTGLMLTTSSRPPIGQVLSFPTALAVSTYFGASSPEATEAAVYFSGYDGSSIKPGALLMAQYPQNAVSAYERGSSIASTPLTTLQGLSGTLTVTVDGFARTAGSLSLAAATSFSAAAGIIQNGLNAFDPTIASFTASIAGNNMTVTGVTSGIVGPGETVTGSGVAANTIITQQISGAPGGTGVYLVSVSQNINSEPMTGVATPVTVTYDSVSGALVITSGVTGAISTIGYASGGLASPLGLTQLTGAVLSQGAAAATPAAFMSGIILTTTNWGSFMTIFNPDVPGSAVNKLAFAQWTSQQDNEYCYVAWDTDVNPQINNQATSSFGNQLIQAGYSGTCAVWEPTNLHHAAFVCGAIASINFNQTNGRATLAFKNQSGLTPAVTDPTSAANLQANGYNYIGAYATATQSFNFFYPGSVSGPFKWLDSYVNQIWLNSSFQAALITLLTNMPSIPYNTAGYSAISTALATPIAAGLNFGAYRPGVTLSGAQIAAVNAAAGANIAPTLQAQGWYLQISPASPPARQARTTPPMNFWYMDGESVQQMQLASIDLL